MTTDQSNVTGSPATAKPGEATSGGPNGSAERGEPIGKNNAGGEGQPDGSNKPAEKNEPAGKNNTAGEGESAGDGEAASSSEPVGEKGKAKPKTADDKTEVDGTAPDLTKKDDDESNGKKDDDKKSNGKKDGDEKTSGEKKDGDAAEPGAADPWSAFAPAPEPVVGRIRRGVRAVGRVLIHEWTLASLASVALAVLMTWPTLRYPLHTIPQDVMDPTLQAWQMAWSGHILKTDPLQLWHSNTFFPEQWSFAFSDTLLGYAPAGMIGEGPVAAILRYNIIFVLAHALAVLGAYALVRQLGSGRIGAAVAGVAYAYAPWLLAQAGHLHVISHGGIPLALAMLARGHGYSLRHGYRPERRHAGWAFAGWLVAAWQISLGFGIGLPFAYALAVIALVALVTWIIQRWMRKVQRPFGFKLLFADAVGGLVFAATGALLAIPYFTVAEAHPGAERTLNQAEQYSIPPTGFLTAPPESLIWGDLHEQARAALPGLPETTVLPGYVLYALALGGLFFSIWTVRQRLFLLAGALATGILAMGPRFFGGTYTFNLLFEYLPGWNGIRTPGRLMIWTTLLLGILAAGAVSALAARAYAVAAERIPPWPGPWLRLVTLLPLVLVLAEGLNVTPHPVVPAQPEAMRTAQGPILVLPSNQNVDQNVMLWSTTRFQNVVNGEADSRPSGWTRFGRSPRVSPTRPASATYGTSASGRSS